MVTIHSSPSSGVSQADPVRGAIASTTETSGINQGFQQERTVAITLLPVAWELTGGARQNRRSQSFHLDPRKNQESAVVDDVLQVARALSRVPTAPAITQGP